MRSLRTHTEGRDSDGAKPCTSKPVEWETQKGAKDYAAQAYPYAEWVLRSKHCSDYNIYLHHIVPPFDSLSFSSVSMAVYKGKDTYQTTALVNTIVVLACGYCAFRVDENLATFVHMANKLGKL